MARLQSESSKTEIENEKNQDFHKLSCRQEIFRAKNEADGNGVCLRRTPKSKAKKTLNRELYSLYDRNFFDWRPSSNITRIVLQ